MGVSHLLKGVAACVNPTVPSKTLITMDVDIPVYRDVSRLFKFMHYIGALIFLPYSSESDGSRLIRWLRTFQSLICFSIFLLLTIMTIFEIYQFALLIWKMKNIAEIIPNIIWVTSFPLAVMAQVFYMVRVPGASSHLNKRIESRGSISLETKSRRIS